MNDCSLDNASTKTHEQTLKDQQKSLFSRDTLYAQYFSAAPQFSFDAQVAAVFPDMIRRSVPGYGTLLEIVPAIAAQTLSPGDRVYDLGCSVGAGLLAVQHALPLVAEQHAASANRVLAADNDPTIELIGVDTSAEMLTRAKALFEGFSLEAFVPPNHTQPEHRLKHNTDFLVADIREITLQPAKLILLNYTLQFLPIEQRDTLIRKIYHSLVPGGALLISEKVIDPEDDTEACLGHLHETFKLSQGYSALEVARKREALENVLVREHTDAHLERLSQAGFHQVTRVMQCLQFTSWLAKKPG
jgi:tRNA (cmo5U34)-methyltransferase